MQSGEHESEGIISIMKYSILHGLAFPPGWKITISIGYNWLNDSRKYFYKTHSTLLPISKNEIKGKYGITLCYTSKVHGSFY